MLGWSGLGGGREGRAGQGRAESGSYRNMEPALSGAGAGTTLKDRTLNSEHRTLRTQNISMASHIPVTAA